MKILVTTGMPGSGKEELLKCCEARGARVVRMGDFVREKAEKFGLSPSDASVGGLADEERKRYGMDIWAKRIIPFVGGDLVVIDGTRGPDEIAAFKKAFGDALKVVAVHSSPRTRFDRLQSRGRSDSPASFVEFDARDRRELDWGLGDAIALADYLIVNEGTLEELREQVSAFLDRLLEKG
ncbi:MAG: flagellar hook-basal body complex protein FliE [Methanobacteriota archaeon]|nr:MAG: flagellar hook-basal body complex protein FliE [Euryarchaeota archaeon]